MEQPDSEPEPTGDRLDLGARAAQIFGPLLERDPWAATGFLVVSALMSLVWFTVVVAALAVSVPLMIIGIGIPLTVGVLALAARIGRIERSRANWIGRDIGEPRVQPARRGLRDLGIRLSDSARWKPVAYCLVAPIVCWGLLVLALVLWLAPLYLLTFPLWGWAVGVSALGLAASVVAGVVVAAVTPRAVPFLARGGAAFTAVVLGPDRLAAMQARVDTLTTNREEILAAVASERRRIERNLHDGVQQQLVAMGIDLALAANRVESDPDEALVLLRNAQDKTRATIGELRVIGRGLHPAILDDRGLDAALSAVVASAPIPIALDVETGVEVPLDVAEAAYFVASEAVSNMLKHADARTGSIRVRDAGHHLVMEVHDDGGGGADPQRGTGLAGMAARVRGLDGTFAVSSPKGGPTVIEIAIPHD